MHARSNHRTSFAVLLLALSAVAPLRAQESGKLVPQDGAPGDAFGSSVAIHGGRIAVGTPLDDDNGPNSGSAYVFDAATGVQLAKLLPGDGAQGDGFGFPVVLGAGVAAVGAPGDLDNGFFSGSAYLFDVTTGHQTKKLVPLDGAPYDYFGLALAIDGGTIAVGAYGAATGAAFSGATYLFDLATGQEVRKLAADDPTPNAMLGFAVAFDAGTVLAGAYGDDDRGPLSGSAYLFDAATGVQRAKLLPADGEAGDRFGEAVALGGGLALVGAPGRDDAGADSGAAYLFDAATGVELARLVPCDPAPGDAFGRSVALDGTRAVVGARSAGPAGTGVGAVYVFDVTNGRQLAKLTTTDGAAQDDLGGTVAVAGGVVVAGAEGDDDQGSGSGAAYVFQQARGGVAQAFCFGTACPCGNDDPGAGCASSTGAGALLTACGSASVERDDLTLLAAPLPPHRPAFFFLGPGQGQAPFGDGLRCVTGPLLRFATVDSGAAGRAQLGPALVRQAGARFGAGTLTAGTSWGFQVGYRDPAGPCGSGANVSSALLVTFVD